MTTNAGNEVDTAVTVFADDNIKELLKSGKIEDIQKIVQEGQSSLPVTASCFSWSKGQIVGKYEIIRKIGKGGMGVIYLARHTQLDTLRALKVLPAESADENPVFAERFIREARIASQIRHPNVVEVMDVESDPQLNVSYIVMEYVDGGSLRQILKGQSKLNIEQAIVTIQSVASALCIAAEHGIVHRDIKPDNIMFTKRGIVKLADLGIAKKEDEDDNLTKTNVMMGTPAYLSPEQVENPKAVDIRSDIYSLGATFYEMLTGQPPYPGKTSYDILRKIFSDPVPDPRDFNPEIPVEIASVVMKMLAKEADQRYQTPQQLLDNLNKFIPVISDTEMQMIVKSIIGMSENSNSEFTAYNSVISSTLCGLQRKARKKKITLLGIAISLIAAAVAGIAMFLGTDVCKQLLLQESDTPITPAPAAVVPTAEEVKSVPPQEVYHSLDIETTPKAVVVLLSPADKELSYTADDAGKVKISGLSAGEYEVKITCPDFYPHTRKLHIPDTTELKIALKPELKKLVLTAPAGTKIELQTPDGQKKGFTIPAHGTLSIADLKKGNYWLKASCQGYFPVENPLSVTDDTAWAVRMEKIFKKFTVNTLPASKIELSQNSEVKYRQTTDSKGSCVIAAVSKGVYELQITAANYKTHNSIVVIEKDISINIPLIKEVYSLTVYGTAGLKIQLLQGKKQLQTVVINQSGSFTFSGLNIGEYSLVLSQASYVTQKQTVRINGNVSLQANLVKIPIKKPVPPPPPVIVPKFGKISIYLSAAPELMSYVQKEGLEIKVGKQPWQKIHRFPLTLRIPVGKVPVSVRGKGIQSSSCGPVQITANQNTDFLLPVQAQMVTLICASNRSDAVFTVNGKNYRAGKKILLAAFKDYPVKAVSGTQTMSEIVRTTEPDKTMEVGFTFIDKIQPMQWEYEEALELIKNKEYEEALKILQPLAEAKHAASALTIAEIYEKGLGMWFSDQQKAYHYYVLAARAGDIVAAEKMANAIFNGDYDGSAETMLDFYLQVLKQKNAAEIAYRVADFYENGYQSIAANKEKALLYLQKAAEAGHPSAMFDLGIRYEKGQGVPFNLKTALQWIQKAAEAGHDQAKRYQKRLNQ